MEQSQNFDGNSLSVSFYFKSYLNKFQLQSLLAAKLSLSVEKREPRARSQGARAHQKA